jgi:hypothetical protein
MANNSRRFVRATGRHGVKAVIVCGVLALAGLIRATTTEAHKAITSPYNFNEHVLPIVEERCAACHFEGGPTPMALTSYRDAVPWAESIREQLVGERMPPWYADPVGPAVRGGHSITTRELDILITWAIGGAPQGTADTDHPPYTPPEPRWERGTPDLTLEIPTEQVVPAGTMEQDEEFTLATDLKEETWVNVVDVMPGNRSMVRDAVVSLENGLVLATWVPGYEALPAPSDAAFKLPANARLVLQMHYKKHYLDEQNDVADRTTVGLYFTDAPLSGRSIEAVTLQGPDAGNDLPRTVTFGGATLESNARIVSVRPSFDRAYQTVSCEGVLADGRRVTLLNLNAAQPQWYRRYWLLEPIELPKGAKIEVTATPAQPDEFAIPIAKRYPLQVGIDYVPQ